MTDNFYGEVLADHNLHPLHRHDLPDATHVCKGLNPTCGDDIELHLDIHYGPRLCDIPGIGRYNA